MNKGNSTRWKSRLTRATVTVTVHQTPLETFHLTLEKFVQLSKFYVSLNQISQNNTVSQVISVTLTSEMG